MNVSVMHCWLSLYVKRALIGYRHSYVKQINQEIYLGLANLVGPLGPIGSREDCRHHSEFKSGVSSETYQLHCDPLYV